VILLDKERPAAYVLAVGHGVDNAKALLNLWRTLNRRARCQRRLTMSPSSTRVAPASHRENRFAKPAAFVFPAPSDVDGRLNRSSAVQGKMVAGRRSVEGGLS
jgi:hypothetical protein